MRLSRLFYGVCAVLLVSALPGESEARVNSRKPNSVRQSWVECRLSGQDLGRAVVRVLEKADENPAKIVWKIEEAPTPEKTTETRLRSFDVAPMPNFSRADALTGSTRFMKSLTVKGEGITLVITNEYSSLHQGFAATAAGKSLFCSVNGSFYELLRGLQEAVK